uniref:Uncharacterized protein n=1 Tax=Parascaris univalens TaxID=6257 RepID=A0A915BVZ5_PARUN
MSGHKRGSPPQISRRATTSARISHREELEVPMVATAKKSRSVSVVDVLLERADDSTRVEKTRRKKSVVKHNVKSLRSMIYGLSISAEREEAEYAKLQRRLRGFNSTNSSHLVAQFVIVKPRLPTNDVASSDHTRHILHNFLRTVHCHFSRSSVQKFRLVTK